MTKPLHVLCMLAVSLSSCGTDTPAPPREVRSLLEARQSKVVVQKWDVSCGAAALASLMTYDLDTPMSERDVAFGLLHFTSVEKVKSDLGFSLLDLKRFADSRGFVADGYGDMTLRDLIESAPAIVPVVLRGFNHFVVFRGMLGDRVLLADPAWGNRTMQVPYFMSVWQTRIAFTVARPGPTPTVHHMLAKASDFWSSSPIFESREEATTVTALMDQPPATAQMIAKTAPLDATAAGSGGALPQGHQGAPSTPPAPATSPASAPASKPVAAAGARPVRFVVASRTGAPSAVDATALEMRKGDILFAMGNVKAARHLYERAAAAGDEKAVTAVGRTYDPAILHQKGLPDSDANADMAEVWYRIAMNHGDRSALALLLQLYTAQGA